MRSLVWNTSDAVWVDELDDQHVELFAAVEALRQSGAGAPADAIQRLRVALADHMAHEERLMRAARYEGYPWHKQQHDAARRRVRQFAGAVDRGERSAVVELGVYLVDWLQRHTRTADPMLGAFLRNQRRCVKLTFRVGTKAAGACDWVDSRGDRFDPR